MRKKIRIKIRELRRFIRESIEDNRSHKWTLADDENLMLDKEGMEKSDRENVSNFLRKLGLKK